MFRWIPDWRNFKNEFCNSCQFRDSCAEPLSRTAPDPVPDLVQDSSRASTISSVHVDCTDPKRQSCRTAAWKRMSALSVSPPNQWHVEVEVVKPWWSGRIHVVLVLVKIKTVTVICPWEFSIVLLLQNVHASMIPKFSILSFPLYVSWVCQWVPQVALKHAVNKLPKSEISPSRCQIVLVKPEQSWQILSNPFDSWVLLSFVGV